MSIRCRWNVLLVLFCACAASRAAEPVEFCVADDSDFAAALGTAHFAAVDVKLVRGTYHFDATSWWATNNNADSPTPGTAIRGGYSSDCATRDIAADNTVITENASPGADVTGAFIQLRGNLTLEGVTLELAHGFYIYAGNGTDVAPDSEVLIRRSVIHDSGTATASTRNALTVYWNQSSDVGGRIRLVDTLIYGNGGGCVVYVFVPGGSPVVQFINDTIANNNRGACLDDHDGDGDGSIAAFNSIFYGNGGHDLSSDNAATILSHDVIGNGGYPTPIAPPIAVNGNDPKLDGNHRPIESPPSPVVNSGTSTVPGGLPASDLDGGARVIGSAPDRGAYESHVDDLFNLVVRNTDDSGTGSLRAAINGANSNGSGSITFDIGSSCGPQVITLSSNLPRITAPVVINGYTQTGAAPNTLDIGDDATICVILESGNISASAGLEVDANAGDGVALTVRGLAFGGFGNAGVDLAAGSNHVVSGNHFGGSVGGHALAPNDVSIRLEPPVHDSIVGGADNAQRNIVSGGDIGIAVEGSGSGAFLIGAHDNQIVNNLIGLGFNPATGAYVKRGNSFSGVLMKGHDNTVTGNVIGDNGADGVLLEEQGAVGNVIADNLIGTTEFGGDVGGGGAGVATRDNAHDNTIRDNTIADNAKEGVRIETGAHNRLRRNSIYGNGLLGIDLAAAGVTPNDDDSAIQQSGYANRGQNFPLLSSALLGSGGLQLTLALTTTPGDYTVDFYSSGNCDASGYGEGRNWLGARTVTVPGGQVGGQGTVGATLTLAAAGVTLHSGDAITATATDASGDSSELAQCLALFIDDLFADSFE